MEVILLERVGKLSQMGETVRVKDGFARNFLLPRGKALRATAENKQRFEGMRAELEKLRLHCDVVLPAEAQRKASEQKARALAAPTIENGKAAAEALKLVCLNLGIVADGFFPFGIGFELGNERAERRLPFEGR